MILNPTSVMVHDPWEEKRTTEVGGEMIWNKEGLWKSQGNERAYRRRNMLNIVDKYTTTKIEFRNIVYSYNTFDMFLH